MLERILPIKSAVDPQDGGLFSAANGTELRRVEAWFKSRVKEAKAARDYVSETVKCSPVTAEFLLSRNSKNRPVSPGRVDQYVAMIRDGHWKRTSQGISINSYGELNNGQHRLSAIAKAGITVPLYITFGEDPNVFDVLDTGRLRTNSDIAALAGFKNYNVLCAACRLLKYIEVNRDYSKKAIRNDELTAFINGHEGLEEATTTGIRVAVKFHAGGAPPTVASYLIRRDTAFPGKVDEFFDRLCHGDNLPRRSPVLALRDLYGKRKLDVAARGSADRAWLVAASIINAWNMWVANKNGDPTALLSGNFPKVV